MFFIHFCIYINFETSQNSLKVIKNALVDISVKQAKVYDHFQFERIGYFSVDPVVGENQQVSYNLH